MMLYTVGRMSPVVLTIRERPSLSIHGGRVNDKATGADSANNTDGI